MYYPPLGNLFELPPLTRLVTGREVDNSRHSIIIMWTTVAEVPNKGQADSNHFVPLIPNDHVPSPECILCDTDSDNMPKPPKRWCVDDDIGPTSVKVIECADQIDSTKTVKSFMQCNQIVSILTDPTTVPLPSVPRGPKANTHFVIDNTQNCTRKDNGQSNRFWDDCGIWDSSQCRNLVTAYLQIGSKLKVVKVIMVYIASRSKLIKKSTQYH